jgi:acyl-CoA synthetase (AMP-forming)/AMP-acid ligase II
METMTGAVLRHARERPAAPALADDRFRLAWREVADWVEAAAGWLSARDLARGTPVLGWLPNCVEWYLLRFSCERAGLLWIPVPASQGRRELASILERVRPAVLVTKGNFRKRDYAAEADEICAALGLAPERITLTDARLLSLEGPPPKPDTALQLDEAAHALTSSGSEGAPKIAVYTLRTACRRAYGQIELLDLTADDVILVLSPGVGPARAAWLAAPISGSHVVTVPIFSADAALALIREFRPTMVCGSPAQLAMLAPRLDATDTSTLRIWYTSGAVMPPTLAAELEGRTGARVVSTYGGADFGGWAAPHPADPPEVRHHTVGRPRGGTEIRIVDSNGNDVVDGEIGQIVGRGPCCIDGYFGEQGRDRWQDGWFHTGDLGRWQGGNLVIVGRVKDVIIRGGDKVVPAEVEALLRTHPSVRQASIVGIPDSVLGERVCACVVASGRAVELNELREHLRRQGLAHYKCPDQLLVLDVLPTVGDKIDRRALTALATRELEAHSRIAP